jgi:RNA polymerase sigma-70 factor, ECF subfamily
VIEPTPELLVRCQQGDTLAFARLMADTQVGVYSLAYNVLRNHEEAQDMTQEVYLRVWRALPGFRSESRFTTWLYRIAVNTCLNRRRQLRVQLNVLDTEDALDKLVAPDPDPLLETVSNQRNASLWAIVDRLPPKYRLVITLFYQQQMSYQEIAQVLSLPVGTVKVHLNRAREALARSLPMEWEAQDDQL